MKSEPAYIQETSMQTLADLPSTAPAMTTLAAEQPLIATRIATMPAVEDAEKSSSISTDGTTIFVDPSFLGALDDAGRVYVLAFTALSLVFDFIGRKGDRNASVWSMAANISTHNVLEDDGVKGRPDAADGLHDPEMKGLTAEDIYDRLMDGRKLMLGKQLGELVLSIPAADLID